MFKKLLALLSSKGKRDLCISAFFFSLYGLSSVAMLVIVFSLVFKITAGAEAKALYTEFILLIALVIFKGICNMVADLKKHEAGFDIVQQIRERLIIKLKRFSLGFYTNERLGEINTVLHKDVDNMSMVVGHMWSRMLGDFLVAFMVFAGLFALSSRLALIMIFGVLVALGFLYYTIRLSKKVEHDLNESLLDMVSLFVEYVRSIPVLKSFSNNKSLDHKLIQKTTTFGETSNAASKFKAKQLSIFGFLLDLGYFILLFSGGIMAFNGRIDIFYFMIFAVVSKEFYKPFASMEMHYMYYISAVDSYKRLGKILFEREIEDKKRVLYQIKTISLLKTLVSFMKKMSST